MDRELARLVAVTAIQASSRLGDLLPTLKEHLDEAEYLEIRGRFANAIGEIGDLVINPALARHPDLEAEIEANVQKYGFAF